MAKTKSTPSRYDALIDILDEVWAAGYNHALLGGDGLRSRPSAVLTSAADRLDRMIHDWWIADDAASGRERNAHKAGES